LTARRRIQIPEIAGVTDAKEATSFGRGSHVKHQRSPPTLHFGFTRVNPEIKKQ
jgi:hypothetical protein